MYLENSISGSYSVVNVQTLCSLQLCFQHGRKCIHKCIHQFGDFFPLITAIVTIVLLVCSIIHIFVKKRVLVRCMMALYIAAAACSVLHVLLNGFRAVTVVNGAVVILFAVGIWLLVMGDKKSACNFK